MKYRLRRTWIVTKIYHQLKLNEKQRLKTPKLHFWYSLTLVCAYLLHCIFLLLTPFKNTSNKLFVHKKSAYKHTPFISIENVLGKYNEWKPLISINIGNNNQQQRYKYCHEMAKNFNGQQYPRILKEKIYIAI